jgi:hypothetical protein
MTIMGLSLSVGCLALHLAIFLATPLLRNLPAMNLASLCVALLLLYCSFLARMAVDDQQCLVLALTIYYSMLATFCWMLIISFDVWKAIRRSTKRLQFSSGENSYRKHTQTIHRLRVNANTGSIHRLRVYAHTGSIHRLRVYAHTGSIHRLRVNANTDSG